VLSRRSPSSFGSPESNYKVKDIEHHEIINGQNPQSWIDTVQIITPIETASVKSMIILGKLIHRVGLSSFFFFSSIHFSKGRGNKRDFLWLGTRVVSES